MAKNGRRFSPWVLVGVAIVAVVLFGVGGGLISAFDACLVDPYTTVCSYVRPPPIRHAVTNDSSAHFAFTGVVRKTFAYFFFPACGIRLRHMANDMALVGHLLRRPWLPLAWVTLFSLLVRSLDHIPRITAASSCSVQPWNRICEWGKFWHYTVVATAAATAALHPAAGILRRTSPIPSTCCTCCAFEGSIYYYSAFAAKCTCAAVPSGGTRIHTGVSTTTAYRQDLQSLRSSHAVIVLSEVRVCGHDHLMYEYVFDGGIRVRFTVDEILD
jgi:hypothetical protein